MPASKKNSTVHEIVELWRSVILRGNNDFDGVLDVSVTAGSVTIYIGFGSDCYRERREDVAVCRLLWWHTQARIFRKLNRRVNYVCRKVRAPLVFLPDPNNPLRLIKPGRSEANSE